MKITMYGFFNQRAYNIKSSAITQEDIYIFYMKDNFISDSAGLNGEYLRGGYL